MRHFEQTRIGRQLKLLQPEHQYYLWSAISGALLKSIGFLAALAALGMASRALDGESFGQLSTAIAALGALQLLDFGVGYAAGNQVAMVRHKSAAESQQVISSMLLFYGVISLLIGCIWLALPASALPALWQNPIGGGVAWLLATLSLASTGLSRVQFVMQHQYFGNLFQLSGGVLAAVGTWLLVHTGRPQAELLFVTIAGIPICVTLLGIVWYGWRQREYLLPSRQLSPKITSSLLRQAVPFCLSQIASTCLANMPALFAVAWFGGSVAGGLFLAQRLHVTIYLGLTIVLTPIWPLLRNSVAAGKPVELRKLILRFTALLLVLGLPSFAIAGYWAPEIVAWQSGGKLPLDPWAAKILGLVYFLSVTRHLLSMVAAGLDSVRLHGVAGLCILIATLLRIAIPPSGLSGMLYLFLGAELLVIAMAIGDVYIGALNRYRGKAWRTSLVVATKESTAQTTSEVATSL